MLVLPKEHVSSIRECQNAEMLGRLFQAARDMAQDAGLSKGYRLIVNTGADGGQTVDHLHIHILGGRFMRWPPG